VLRRKLALTDEMIVESLNVGLPKTELYHGREIRTAMSKRPVLGPVRLGTLGFEGDGVADRKVHGGPDKAVCVYGTNHYPFWEETLGVALPQAAFGENLSVSSLREEAVCIGDVFQVGTALVQVSQPRQPCATLAARYGRPDIVALVVETGRTGFYFRVLDEGVVEAGVPLEPVEKDQGRISVAYASRIYHHERDNLDGIERVLAIQALSASWRESFQKLLERCRRRRLDP
jgi:MOSC domain-containing protein YiiM